MKQNFILQQVCFQKRERRFGKAFGSGPVSVPGLKGSARLDWSPLSSLLSPFLSSYSWLVSISLCSCLS